MVENILGQFCCAFGHGAGPIRIQRAVISALRQRYYAPVAANTERWEDSAAHVLAFMTQIGRLASHYAVIDGRSSINADDFTRARQLVEQRVHAHPDQSRTLHAGIFCQRIPGELPPQPAGDVREPLTPAGDAPTATVPAIN